MIRPVQPSDNSSITAIYNYYIKHSTATFEEIPVSEQAINERVLNVTKDLPWLVFEDNDQIIGYAYATKWRARSAYRFSVETSIYVDPKNQKKGIGSKLYKTLIDRLLSDGYHTIIGGITLPNDASVRLHEKLGFKKVAEFEEVGFKFDRWLNVGYWQLFK